MANNKILNPNILHYMRLKKINVRVKMTQKNLQEYKNRTKVYFQISYKYYFKKNLIWYPKYNVIIKVR